MWLWCLFILPLGGVVGLARDGSIDLQGWDGKSVVSLDGTWKFWGRTEPGDGFGRPIAVPGVWNNVLGTSDGWGVYRLVVQLPSPPPATLALAMPQMNSAAEVRWDGEVVWRVGTWSRDPYTYRPDRRTGIASLRPSSGSHLLEVRVANWGDLYGGLTEPLRLGPEPLLLTNRATEINFTVFVFGCLFVMGIYHFGLFAFRPKDRSALWFGCLAVLLGLRGLVYGPGYLADLVPALDWTAEMRLGYLTFSASALFLGLFVQDLFPRLVPRWFLPTILGGAGTYTLAVLVLPPAWFAPVLPFFQTFAAAEGLIVSGLLILAVRHREQGARLFLAGFLLFFLAALHDIFKSAFSLPTPELSSPGLLVFLVFQSLVVLRQFTAAFEASESNGRHLARINRALGRFIPGAVLGFLDKRSIADVELGDHCERSMAVLFADIRDFTHLSETMSPEENFRFINSYLRRMGPVVRRHDGFVDKYLGDGILALFPGTPSHVLDAALDLRLALEEYNGHRAKSGYTAIRMGIGIHHGPLMLGTIGENERMDSTVISDTVNAASRLEGLTKKFGRDILVSEETLGALGTDACQFEVEYLEEETVKGRTKPLRVYALKTKKPATEPQPPKREHALPGGGRSV